MTDILKAVRLALDPTGVVLQWTGNNPCDMWVYSATSSQVPASAVFGQSWNGLVCKDTYTTATASATAEGGILSLSLAFPSLNATLPLTGSVPLELRELRTATTINLGGHLLTSTLPACWGQNYSRTFFPAGPGFDKVTLLGFGMNQLQGSLPPLLGTGMPAGALIVLDNNNFTGTLPTSLTGKTVTVAGNWPLYGTVPAGVTVQNATDPTGVSRRFFQTSIGLNDAMSNVLLAAKPGLDTIGVLNSSWVPGANPCTNWTGVVCGENSTTGGVTQLLLDSAGLNGTVACELLQLRTVRVLWLHDNTLNGGLPDLSSLPLTNFRINTNRLAGSIPAAYGNLGAAFNFSVFNNPNLCGTVPGNLSTTGQLFGGTVRTQLGAACVVASSPVVCAAQPGVVAVNTSVTCAAVVLPPPPSPPLPASTCSAVPNSAIAAPTCPTTAPPSSPPPALPVQPPGIAAPSPMLYSLPSGMYAYYTAVRGRRSQFLSFAEAG